MQLGEKYTVKQTAMNQKNGLQPGKGAWIIYVDQLAISLYFEQSGVPNMKVPRDLFGHNFDKVKFAMPNASGALSSHAPKTYG